jgi:hypothetical protein
MAFTQCSNSFEGMGWRGRNLTYSSYGWESGIWSESETQNALWPGTLTENGNDCNTKKTWGLKRWHQPRWDQETGQLSKESIVQLLFQNGLPPNRGPGLWPHRGTRPIMEGWSVSRKLHVLKPIDKLKQSYEYICRNKRYNQTGLPRMLIKLYFLWNQ